MSKDGAGRQAHCLICAHPLIYHDAAQDVVCALCGKPDRGRCLCEEGHYVCDGCHREQGVDDAFKGCLASSASDPVFLAQQIMARGAFHPNGPEHHGLVGACLLTAFRNAGGAIHLESALEELKARSAQVPGGTCGYWGVCGAAASAGQACSIILGATPLSESEWAACARLVSRITGRLADMGGPRCCKRATFTALEESAVHLGELTGIQMEMPDRIVCTFMGGNRECKGGACPYHPLSAPAVG